MPGQPRLPWRLQTNQQPSDIMIHAIRALIWEQVWKNRVVFPMLVFLLGVSFALLRVTQHSEPGTWLKEFANIVTPISFLSSMVLGIAPFTLMESNGGWRMNSMVTRWFVLPVPAVVLVLISLAMLAGIISLILSGWWAIFISFAPVTEAHNPLPVLVVWLVGAALLQAVAWTVPRRPSQYWCIAGLLFPIIMVVGFTTAGDRVWVDHAPKAYGLCGLLLIALIAYGCYAAKKNRCGDWAGEVTFGRIVNAFLGLRPQFRNPRSRLTAILGSDTLGPVFSFSLTWILLGVILLGGYSMLARDHASEWLWAHLGWKTPIFMALHTLPLLAVAWLAGGALYFGGEPGFGFRTRLSAFRATTPASSGVLAMQRIATPLLAWVAVWLPLLLLSTLYEVPREQWSTPDDPARQLAPVMARLMVVSAHFVVGALPLFLLGRLEGLPNMFLCSILVWAAPFLLGTFMGPEEHLNLGLLCVVSIWLIAKILVTAFSLARSLRDGEITWRFAAGLVGGWLVLAAFLTWGLPIWQKWGASGLLGVVVFLPLARIALCPMAISANRHR